MTTDPVTERYVSDRADLDLDTAAALVERMKSFPEMGDLWVHVALFAGVVVMLGPFAWQLLTSVKPLSEAVRIPPTLLPEQWRWDNFAEVFRAVPFRAMYVNTVAYAVLRTIGQLVLCSAAAFAFARLRFPGRNILFALCLSALMVPPELFVIPQYQIMQHLGWLNSLQALVLPSIFTAFGTFLLRQFFATIPIEIEEAARIDGANPFQIYWRIFLPLAKPGLIALAIITVIAAWSDLLWPLIVNTDPNKMTLSVGLASLQGQQLTDYPVLMAGALLASAPLIAVFIIMQRRFVEGIALTGTKG
jgi:multiple sugar transport system permease protein